MISFFTIPGKKCRKQMGLDLDVILFFRFRPKFVLEPVAFATMSSTSPLFVFCVPWQVSVDILA